MASSRCGRAVMVLAVFPDDDSVGDHGICMHQLAVDTIRDAINRSEGAPRFLQSTLSLEGADGPRLGTEIVGATRHGLSGVSWA